MRAALLFFALLLVGCGRPANGSWHMTPIAGAMPPLTFHLTRAADGKPVTGADYRGQVVALYFGYTNCPDVCPATLANLTEMMNQVGSRKVKVLFVTVDPRRDTADILAKYAAAFSPQIQGLRGTEEQLAELARRYRVAYSVKPGPPYDVMHSNAVFFFDATGRIRLVTTDTTNTAAMARDVKKLL